MKRRGILIMQTILILVFVGPALAACNWPPIGGQSRATEPVAVLPVLAEATLSPSGTATGSAPVLTLLAISASPIATSTAASFAGGWEMYTNFAFQVSLRYPAHWQRVNGDTAKYAGTDGFFGMDALGNAGAKIDEIAADHARHKLQPYDPRPTIESLEVQGQEARLILPEVGVDLPAQAMLIVRYPQPVQLGQPCEFFALYADRDHIRAIAETLRFLADITSTDTPTPISGPSATAWLLTSTPEPEPRRILFAEGTTSATVIHTLQPGGADRYIVRALAGQTLVVDIAASHPVLLHVWGADGAVLRKDAGGTAHWQGTLPSAQDYWVEIVSTDSTADYQMNVTIPKRVEPDPAPSIYYNKEYGFEVQYPADLTVEVACDPAASANDPVVDFRLTGDRYYSGTNLVKACVIIGAGRTEEARAMCTVPRVPHEQDLGEQEINSIAFHKSSRVGIATGNVYDITSYRTLYSGVCYEIALFLHFHDVSVFEPGTVSEFDREGVMDRLLQVLYTFRFTN